MAPGLKQKLDYSDIAAVPEDGKRYELVQGELFVNPAPSPVHQRISRRLHRQLENYFHDRKIGEIFNAPVDLILTNQDVFVPDLLVAADLSHISRRGIEAPPLLVVEILSPSTRKVDRGIKSRRYAELGVRQYWIVDPEARSIECFRLEDGAFEPAIDAQGAAPLSHPDFEALTVDLEALWR